MRAGIVSLPSAGLFPRPNCFSKGENRVQPCVPPHQVCRTGFVAPCAEQLCSLFRGSLSGVQPPRESDHELLRHISVRCARHRLETVRGALPLPPVIVTHCPTHLGANGFAPTCSIGSLHHAILC